MKLIIMAICGAALLWGAPALSQGRGVVLQNGTVMPANGPVIERGVVILGADGKIEGVGVGLAAPAGYEVVDATGKVITPGFIDPHTALGLVEIGAVTENVDTDRGGSDPVRAAFRVEDGFNPNSAVLPVQRSGGVTAAIIAPSGGLVAGQGAWIALGAPGAFGALRGGGLALYVHLGQEGSAASGGARGATALRLRELFDDARYYKANRQRVDEQRARPLSTSRLHLEAALLALEGKIPVVFSADRASDIELMLRLSKEWGLRPILLGGAEAWMVRAPLAAAKVPVILYALNNLPFSFESLGSREDNAALLVEAGVPVCLSAFDTHNARNLRQMAGNAVRAGLDPQDALRAVTLYPARAFGLEREVGALGAGLRADVVLWSGDPFELSSRVERLWINGQETSLRSRQTALFDKYRQLPRRDPPPAPPQDNE